MADFSPWPEYTTLISDLKDAIGSLSTDISAGLANELTLLNAQTATGDNLEALVIAIMPKLDTITDELVKLNTNMTLPPTPPDTVALQPWTIWDLAYSIGRALGEKHNKLLQRLGPRPVPPPPPPPLP